MTFIRDISLQYFGFRPALRHLGGCARTGSEACDATVHTWESADGRSVETTFRLACPDCGAMTFFGFDSEASTEFTSSADIGFGSKPERVAGLWLHPGPRLLRGDEHGPAAFYVTRGKDRPRDPADVLGAVAWHFGPRLGVKWSAGLGLTERGNAQTRADRDFGSKRAAVNWVTEKAISANKTEPD
jgi:hypothetical protein